MVRRQIGGFGRVKPDQNYHIFPFIPGIPNEPIPGNRIFGGEKAAEEMRNG
jgi:hypothetical protein